MGVGSASFTRLCRAKASLNSAFESSVFLRCIPELLVLVSLGGARHGAESGDPRLRVRCVGLVPTGSDLLPLPVHQQFINAHVFAVAGNVRLVLRPPFCWIRFMAELLETTPVKWKGT